MKGVCDDIYYSILISTWYRASKNESIKTKYGKNYYWPNTSINPLFLHYQFCKLPSFCGATHSSTSLLRQLLVFLESFNKYTLKGYIKVELDFISDGLVVNSLDKFRTIFHLNYFMFLLQRKSLWMCNNFMNMANGSLNFILIHLYIICLIVYISDTFCDFCDKI